MFDEETRKKNDELISRCYDRYYEGYSCYIVNFVQFCGEDKDSFLYKFLWYLNTPGLWLHAFNEATKSWVYHKMIYATSLNHFFSYYSNRYAKDNGIVNPYENVEDLTNKAIEYIKQIVKEESEKMTK